MAKLAFSKLGLKSNNQVTYILHNEQSIEVKQYKGDDIKEDTIMFKNVASLKKTKEGVSFYLQDGVMYYFEYDDILVGTPEQILNLFKKNGIKVPK